MKMENRIIKNGIAALALSCAIFTVQSAKASAQSVLPLKLPYAKGQSFVVVQGYETPPTHIKKDTYALDFSQNRCEAYGKESVAVAPGTVMFMSEEGYNGGYGTEVIINHGGGIVSRYAHMIPESIPLVPGSAVTRGDVVGRVGNTGLVAGMACPSFPGTHLHFAMDTIAPDGTFVAYRPEPISGYAGIEAGKWYLSDNGKDDGGGAVLGVSVVAAPSSAPSTTPALAVMASSSPNFPMGGVTVVPSVILPSPSGVATLPQDSAPVSSSSSISAPSSTVTSSVPITPAQSDSILFEQDDMSINSIPSWYEDNWYDLGKGLGGTLKSLTLYGKTSDPFYFNSSVSLQAFKDPGYAALVQSFDISENAPFTDAMATATFSGLSIPLKPYFYYRLSTNQAHQNTSVVLAGTASTSVGVMMWDNFIYGTGRVESTSTFSPFMVMEGSAPTSTLVPPPITSPGDLAVSFDELGMRLSPSFSTSTDPDWPGNPLHYEMNYSTSSVLGDDGWTAVGPISVAVGNTYLIGIRARDDFGDVSGVATTAWSFPPGFVPYVLSPGLGFVAQYFTVSVTTTLASIQIFTTNFSTNAGNPYAVNCSIQLFDEFASSSEGMVQSDNGFGGYDCAGDRVYSFASSSPVLYPDHRYHWVFYMPISNPTTWASIQFYGTVADTAGAFSDPSLANAKFTLVAGDGSTIFSN